MNKILVTGFEGYGGRSDNPSAEIAKSIDGYETAGWQVVSRVLPVTNHNIRNNVVSLIDSFNPAAVLKVWFALKDLLPIIQGSRLPIMPENNTAAR
jgi:pyrrolidone-carboxylate peptidase